jgi:hypothetical protein
MYLRKRKRVSDEENVPPNDLGYEVFNMADALLKSQQDLIEQQVRTIEALTDTIIELRSQHEKYTDND